MTIQFLNHAIFTPLLGKNLVLKGDAISITAVLTDVIEYPQTTAPGAPRTAFSVLFSAQTDQFPDAGSGHYVVESEELKSIGPIYVERVISINPNVICLEAAFN